MNPVLLLPVGLHQPTVGDTRALTNWIAVHSEAIETAISQDVAIVGQDDLPLGSSALSWRAGLMAGVFLGFQGGGELTFNLETFDGVFGIPLDVHLGPWQLRAEFAHWSAHTADGIRLRETPPVEARDIYSREWLGAELAYDAGVVRPHLKLRQLVHAVDGGQGAWLGAGFVAALERPVSPYLAGHVWSAAEWSWEQAWMGQVGVRLQGERFTMRGALEGYTGRHDAGKWSTDRERHVGFVLGFDL